MALEKMGGPRHEVISNHVKHSYAGKAVINAFDKQEAQVTVLEDFHMEMVCWEKLIWSYNLRSDWL